VLRDDLLELNRQIATFNGGDSGGQVELATLFTVSGVHMQPVLAVPGPPAGDKSPRAYCWLFHTSDIGYVPRLP